MITKQKHEPYFQIYRIKSSNLIHLSMMMATSHRNQKRDKNCSTTFGCNPKTLSNHPHNVNDLSFRLDHQSFSKLWKVPRHGWSTKKQIERNHPWSCSFSFCMKHLWHHLTSEKKYLQGNKHIFYWSSCIIIAQNPWCLNCCSPLECQETKEPMKAHEDNAAVCFPFMLPCWRWSLPVKYESWKKTAACNKNETPFLCFLFDSTWLPCNCINCCVMEFADFFPKLKPTRRVHFW